MRSSQRATAARLEASSSRRRDTSGEALAYSKLPPPPKLPALIACELNRRSVSRPSPSDRSRSSEATRLSGVSSWKSSTLLPATSCSTVAQTACAACSSCSSARGSSVRGGARGPEPALDVEAHSEPSPLPLECTAGGVAARASLSFLSGGSADVRSSARLVPQSSGPPSSRPPPSSSAIKTQHILTLDNISD
ncbi:unnamed protein product [Arctia plantaginis]|uniref:Uncharacterized protein n=1 Tax=Arctia plantaginis TaxID=874455 RepID=A0A8S1B330_ARCPL|nr:unnamed protein product [Arctia plantaginis]